MKYWLMKSEPSTFSIDDLIKRPSQIEPWEGVRNYQARNFMRDEMKKGDLAFFYHSSCDIPGIAGIIEIISEAEPDLTARDQNSKYYDPKSSAANPRWFLVKVKFKEKFKTLLPLSLLKKEPKLHEMRLLTPGNRLSITPVTKAEWHCIITLEKTISKK